MPRADREGSGRGAGAWRSWLRAWEGRLVSQREPWGRQASALLLGEGCGGSPTWRWLGGHLCKQGLFPSREAAGQAWPFAVSPCLTFPLVAAKTSV